MRSYYQHFWLSPRSCTQWRRVLPTQPAPWPSRIRSQCCLPLQRPLYRSGRSPGKTNEHPFSHTQHSRRPCICAGANLTRDLFTPLIQFTRTLSYCVIATAIHVLGRGPPMWCAFLYIQSAVSYGTVHSSAHNYSCSSTQHQLSPSHKAS